jgi:hypothetical protein
MAAIDSVGLPSTNDPNNKRSPTQPKIFIHRLLLRYVGGILVRAS